MRAVVVGAGAWGLPAAANLALRGHDVVLVDRYGPGNAYSSSSGPTRAWRVADLDPLLIRLGKRSVGAMDRLAARADTQVYRRVGLLWRDPAAAARLHPVLAGEAVAHYDVPAGSVGDYLPGLLPDGRDAVWLPDAGYVLAAESLAAQRRLLESHGGRIVIGSVVSADIGDESAEVVLADGARLVGDVVILAPGPGARTLLRALGIDLELRTYTEQVVMFDGGSGRPDDGLPCLFDGALPSDGTPATASFYAMPTPGVGYKIGLDVTLREVEPGDLDRSPDAVRTDHTRRRAARLGFLAPRAGLPRVVQEQVCTWTASPDGLFVVDRRGPLVLACGDSGKGFKYSALMGEVLADLAEGAVPDDDVAALSLARFAATAS